MNPQGTKLDLAWLGESWKILQSRMGEFIGMVFVAGLLGGVISFVINLPFEIIIRTVARENLVLALGVVGLQIIARVLAQGISYILFAGVMIYTLKLLRGEPAKFEDLFIAFKNPAPYFIGGLLYGLATGLGVLACCIGTFAVGGLLMFMFPLIYDRKLSAFDAMKESINLLKDQWPMAMGYFLVTWLFAIAGVIACIIGIIVTMPIMYIAQALAYHKIVGGATEPFLSPSQYPRNPGDAANMPAAPSAWPTETPAPAPAPETPAPAPTPDPEPPAASVWGDTMAEGAEPAANSPWTGDPAPAADPSATVGEAPAAPAPSVDSDATAGEAPAVSGWGEPVPDPSATVGEAPAVEDHRPDDNPPRPQ